MSESERVRETGRQTMREVCREREEKNRGGREREIAKEREIGTERERERQADRH